MTTAFVLTRQHTRTNFAIQADRDNTGRKRLIAFQTKDHANRMLKMIQQFQDTTKPHQRIIVEKTYVSELKIRCVYGALDLVYYRKNGTVSKYLYNDQEAVDKDFIVLDMEFRFSGIFI